MRRIALATTLTAAVGGLSTVSIAQTGLSKLSNSERRMDKNFDVADKNRDGKLTRTEAQSGATPLIENHFGAIDTENKGYVTKTDVHAFIQNNLSPSHIAPSSSSPRH
jgi:hypothetical protein